MKASAGAPAGLVRACWHKQKLHDPKETPSPAKHKLAGNEGPGPAGCWAGGEKKTPKKTQRSPRNGERAELAERGSARRDIGPFGRVTPVQVGGTPVEMGGTADQKGGTADQNGWNGGPEWVVDQNGWNGGPEFVCHFAVASIADGRLVSEQSRL